MRTQSHIRCNRCRFARRDPSADHCGLKAFECGNSDSEYHLALLNIDKNGNLQKRITWRGCPLGEEGLTQ